MQNGNAGSESSTWLFALEVAGDGRVRTPDMLNYSAREGKTSTVLLNNETETSLYVRHPRAATAPVVAVDSGPRGNDWTVTLRLR